MAEEAACHQIPVCLRPQGHADQALGAHTLKEAVDKGKEGEVGGADQGSDKYGFQRASVPWIFMDR